MVAGRGVIVDAVGKGVQSTLTYARDSITGLNTMLVTETSPLTVLPHTLGDFYGCILFLSWF